jgi:hypothetical protein
MRLQIDKKYKVASSNGNTDEIKVLDDVDGTWYKVTSERNAGNVYFLNLIQVVSVFEL